MKISIKHIKGTKLQKRTIKTIDSIVAKAARRMVIITRESHRIGVNLKGVDMSTLGKEGDGYSKQYDRWKRRYSPDSYDSGVVNLDYSGRFHRDLRISKARVRGESGYYVHSSRPLKPAYVGTKEVRHSYKDIFKDYETFELSSHNRKILMDILRDSKKTILQSILISK